tara:strand:- start:263 stop:406 length:144 start_codon:yes stop_codon:yes gene_type:complete
MTNLKIKRESLPTLRLMESREMLSMKDKRIRTVTRKPLERKWRRKLR